MWSTSAVPRSTGKPGAYRAQCSRPGKLPTAVRTRRVRRATRPGPGMRYRRRPPGTRFHIRPRTARSAPIASSVRNPVVLPFVKGPAWAGQPDASACSLLTADIPGRPRASAQSTRTGARRGPATRPVRATAESAPPAVVGDSGQIHAQFCQEGVHRIITVRSVLSCKESPGERAVSQQWKVTQVKVAVTGPDHFGTVTAAPTGPFPGS
jgi:hypothetical protein